MYLADYHTHSRCSPDGSVTLAEMAAAAVQAGLRELCLTDHCDFINMDGKYDNSFRWAPIEGELRDARPKFEGKLKIKMGLELGEPWEDPALADKITGHPDLDFVIGSVHNLCLDDGGEDFYFVNFKDEATCHRVLEGYFKGMERLARQGSFDVLGHIIYPLRYMNERDGNHVTLERYKPRLETILKEVIRKGKGIELNTCRGRTVQDWREILALYKDCGGEIVTLGSDAHRPRDVAAGLAEGAALLKEYGFRLAVFEKHTPELIAL